MNTTAAVRPEGSLPAVRIWIDPGCPWAWQTALWLRGLRDGGHLTLGWRIFSLELNSSEPGMDFWEATALNGEALVSLALARREGGDEAFERLFWALGGLRHDGGTASSPEMVREAASSAGMPNLVDEALADPTLADLVRTEYEDARRADVFGVPTIQLLPSGDPIYGPIMPVPPTGASALEWWSHVRFTLEHDELYELKRWPRTRRPGQAEAT